MQKENIAVEQLIFMTIKELNCKYGNQERLEILYALSIKALNNQKMSYINEELLKDNIKKIECRLGIKKEKALSKK